MSNMNKPLRKLRGVIGIGLIWAPVWTAMFFALVFFACILAPVRDAVNPSKESGT